MRNDEIYRPHRLYIRRTRDEDGNRLIQYFEDPEATKLFAVRDTPIVYGRSSGFRRVWLDTHSYLYEFIK